MECGTQCRFEDGEPFDDSIPAQERDHTNNTKGLADPTSTYPLATPPARLFYHHDALGSVVNLTDDAAAVTQAYLYDAWGNYRELDLTEPASGIPPVYSGSPDLDENGLFAWEAYLEDVQQAFASDANRFTYTGHAFDPATGLYYFRARFYDPELGRFTSQDPYLGDTLTPPSLHRYLYAYANPLVYVDLTGYSTVFKSGIGQVRSYCRDFLSRHSEDDPAGLAFDHALWDILSSGAHNMAITAILHEKLGSLQAVLDYLDFMEDSGIENLTFVHVEEDDENFHSLLNPVWDAVGTAAAKHGWLVKELGRRFAERKKGQIVDITDLMSVMDAEQALYEHAKKQEDWETSIGGYLDRLIDEGYENLRQRSILESGWEMGLNRLGKWTLTGIRHGVNEPMSMLDPNDPHTSAMTQLKGRLELAANLSFIAADVGGLIGLYQKLGIARSSLNKVDDLGKIVENRGLDDRIGNIASQNLKRVLTAPIPESYMDLRNIVDMEPARSLLGSTLNSAGEVRNANYFWRQLLERRPEMFSKANEYRIFELGLSPRVDKTWLEFNPTHLNFLHEVLHHHHINQGRIAVPLPQSIHEAWTSILHRR